MTNKQNIAPFVKWAGGKRQLLSSIYEHIPESFSTYYEPFVGGGAVLFHLQPGKAVINDDNSELINVYRVIKDKVDELLEHLRQHRNEKDYFYKIRKLDRKPGFNKRSDVERASRTIFLNKTCYNGLYRVNSSGEFNAPFGRYKNPNFVNETTLRAVSRYLNESNVKILNTDYEESLKGIRKGSFVYFDPPYDPMSASANFTGYTSGGFDRNEQIRLKKVCDKLNAKGVKFLLSNSATDFIKELYTEYIGNSPIIVEANRFINSNARKRGKIDEILIKNYE